MKKHKLGFGLIVGFSLIMASCPAVRPAFAQNINNKVSAQRIVIANTNLSFPMADQFAGNQTLNPTPGSQVMNAIALDCAASCTVIMPSDMPGNNGDFTGITLTNPQIQIIDYRQGGYTIGVKNSTGTNVIVEFQCLPTNSPPCNTGTFGISIPTLNALPPTNAQLTTDSSNNLYTQASLFPVGPLPYIDALANGVVADARLQTNTANTINAAGTTLTTTGSPTFNAATDATKVIEIAGAGFTAPTEGSVTAGAVGGATLPAGNYSVQVACVAATASGTLVVEGLPSTEQIIAGVTSGQGLSIPKPTSSACFTNGSGPTAVALYVQGSTLVPNAAESGMEQFVPAGSTAISSGCTAGTGVLANYCTLAGTWPVVISAPLPQNGPFPQVQAEWRTTIASVTDAHDVTLTDAAPNGSTPTNLTTLWYTDQSANISTVIGKCPTAGSNVGGCIVMFDGAGAPGSTGRIGIASGVTITTASTPNVLVACSGNRGNPTTGGYDQGIQPGTTEPSVEFIGGGPNYLFTATGGQDFQNCGFRDGGFKSGTSATQGSSWGGVLYQQGATGFEFMRNTAIGFTRNAGLLLNGTGTAVVQVNHVRDFICNVCFYGIFGYTQVSDVMIEGAWLGGVGNDTTGNHNLSGGVGIYVNGTAIGSNNQTDTVFVVNSSVRNDSKAFGILYNCKGCIVNTIRNENVNATMEGPTPALAGWWLDGSASGSRCAADALMNLQFGSSSGTTTGAQQNNSVCSNNHIGPILSNNITTAVATVSGSSQLIDPSAGWFDPANLTITQQTAASGSSPAAVLGVTGGNGGPAATATSNGNSGSGASIAAGNGSNGGGTSGNGGTGGNLTNTSGNGGTSTSGTGGGGGAITNTAGNGGTSASGAGGNAGGISNTTGTGGNGTGGNANGNGGNWTLTLGGPGTGGTGGTIGTATINTAASAGTADIFDIQNNSSNVARVTSAGFQMVPGSSVISFGSTNTTATIRGANGTNVGSAPLLIQGGNGTGNSAGNAAAALNMQGGDESGASANTTGGNATLRGGNVASTGTPTPGTVTITGGGLTGAATNVAGADVTIGGGLGTGNAIASHTIIQDPAFSNTSGTTAQTAVTNWVVYKKSGSTSSGTAQTLFTIPVAASSTVGVQVIVHVETTQATPHNCSTIQTFTAAAQNTSGTITQSTNGGTAAAGTLATICDTGTLTLTGAFTTASSPVSFQVTPSWTTIVPTGVIITAEVHNLSQQTITASSD